MLVCYGRGLRASPEEEACAWVIVLAVAVAGELGCGLLLREEEQPQWEMSMTGLLLTAWAVVDLGRRCALLGTWGDWALACWCARAGGALRGAWRRNSGLLLPDERGRPGLEMGSAVVCSRC